MNQGFGRLAREFSVIVLGVFVALAAESWWSDREDRRIERELREDMVAEFESNLRILEADIATNEQAAERVGIFSGLSEDELLALPDAMVTARFAAFMIWAGFDPEMGAVQALVESGNVGAIADRQLRLLLARWAGLLEQRRRFNLQAVEFQHNSVHPAIARSGADNRWTPEERRELRSLLAQLLALMGIVIDNQRELRETAADILQYLEENR